jgi:hypothetical protein
MTTYYDQTVFSPWLTPVRVAATSNVVGTYSNGPNNNGVGATLTIAASSLTIDSVVLNVSDRVLLTDQSTSLQNGIYEVLSIGATVVLQRSADFQNIEQIQTGQYVSVKGGSVNAGSFFTLIEPRPQTIGVSAIVFSTDPASGAAVTFSGGPSVANAIPVFSNTAGDIAPQTTPATLGFGLTAATGNIVASTGNLVAGSSGHAGTVASFPGTATEGELILAAVSNAGGNFNTTISNASTVGQAQVVSIPDSGSATAQFLVKTGAFVSGNILIASGTGGVVADSGVPASNYAQVTMSAAQFNGMYAAPLLLVAAPGANSMIIVDNIALVMTYGSAAFAAGGVVAAQYDSTANGAGVIASTTEAAADFFATASTVFKLNAGAVLAPFTTCANKGLYLSNITQAFTTGTGSAFIVKVKYHVISTIA